MTKKKHKPNPRTEVAQRRAISKWLADGGVSFGLEACNGTMTVHAYDMDADSERLRRLPMAIFDLKDCYRKRQPLKGITKKIRRVLQPQRKR